MKQKHQASNGACFGTKDCAFPSDGKDFEDCSFVDESLGNCNGCNLRGADLAFTDVSGASFRDACLVAADFLDANVNGADFRGAILCGTKMPDGSIDNSGCGDETECCPPCLGVGDACGEGIFGDCCDTQCVNGVCEAECAKDSDCSPDEFCCDGLCGNDCCFDSQCGEGVCVDGQCVECVKDTDCPGGARACCDGICEPIDIDPKNCGACGIVCDSNEECCFGICVNTQTDPENCGFCFRDCQSGVCVNGECVENWRGR